MSKLALGLDFGTASVRALVVDMETGEERAEGVAAYERGVMDRELKTGAICKELPPEFALQNAPDYLVAMTRAAREALAKLDQGAVAEIRGVGVDFTACTPLPLKEGQPLSESLPEDPHAYVKLWKHHAAQPFSDLILREAPAELLGRYGGAISCEWLLPKLLEFEARSPEAFRAADRWIEAGDWLVSTLVGREQRPVRSRCQAGYKALWTEETGYPSPALLKRLSPQVAARFEELMAGELLPLGKPAGALTPQWAGTLGLSPGITVAVAAIDAHAGVPGSGVARHGELLSVIGTSTCHMTLSRVHRYLPGIECAVRDGIVPGLVGYEAGQPAVGDLFSWFMRDHGGDFAAMEEAAARVPAGSNGVMALDWWNGARSVLMDSRVKGTWAGLRLTTTPAEMYRSLLEATAYTTRAIVDTMEAGGVPIEKVSLSGGIAAKSPLLCRIYADVLGRPVEVIHARQPVAMGAAIYGAAAANGTDSAAAFAELVGRMTSKTRKARVEPTTDATTYRALFPRYQRLSALMHGFYREASLAFGSA